MELLQNILVFIPVYRLEPETARAVLRFAFKGSISWLFQDDNPLIDGKHNILWQYQRGREVFLNGPWDAMLVIESDIIPPVDTVERLADLDADCAYGVYRFRVSNVINIFERYPDKGGRPPRNVGESLSTKPQLLKRARKVGRWPCSGAGLGCVLIRRHVLVKIDFRMEEPGGAHCDTFFNRDVLAAGYSQWADMNLVCGHKHESGEILWPDFPLRP